MKKAISSIHPIDKHVGGRIREARLLREISQTGLGDALAITFQQVQKYEKGVNRVSSSRLWEIANVLDVDVMHFFEGRELNGLKHGSITNRPEPERMYFTADEIELVRLYRGVPGTEVNGKMRDLLKAVASELSYPRPIYVRSH